MWQECVLLFYSQGKEALQSWGEHTEVQQCHFDWPPGRWTEQCCHPARYKKTVLRWWIWAGFVIRGETELLTLSVRVASQPGTDNSWRTMSTWPCSQAHMSAVEPSSSRMLTWAPQDSSARTMSPRPWLTASISAVWPAYRRTTFKVLTLGSTMGIYAAAIESTFIYICCRSRFWNIWKQYLAWTQGCGDAVKANVQ